MQIHIILVFHKLLLISLNDIPQCIENRKKLHWKANYKKNAQKNMNDHEKSISNG